MRSSRFFLCAIGLLFVSGCAGVSTEVYDPGRLSAVDSWALELAYETGSIGESTKSSGDSESKLESEGNTPRDLPLKDDIYYALKDEYSIPLVEAPAEKSGRIRIYPVRFYSGGFKLLAVTLTHPQGETLARMKIENGEGPAMFKDDDDFANYAAKAIAVAINRK